MKIYGALAILGLILVVLSGVYTMGRNGAVRECDAARLRGRVAQLERDLAIAKAAQVDEMKRVAELAAEANDAEEDARDLAAELAKRPLAARCPATGDDIRRLRGPGGAPAARAPASRGPDVR